MKPFIVLIIAAFGLNASVLAMPTIGIPSEHFAAAQGVAERPLTQLLTLEEPTHRFGTVQMAFQIDVRYVDLEFFNVNGESLRASQAKPGAVLPGHPGGVSWNGNYTLSWGQFIYPSLNYPGTTAEGVIRYLNPNIRQITLSFQKTFLPYFATQDGDFMVDGTGSPIKMLIDTDAIAQAGGAYQMTPILIDTYVYVHDTTRVNIPGQLLSSALTGGSFTVVPEPMTILVLAGGMGVLLKRKKG